MRANLGIAAILTILDLTEHRLFADWIGPNGSAMTNDRSTAIYYFA